MALTDNLTNYWKMDESSGNATDSVGGNTLTNTNITYASGKINNGAGFNSSHTSVLTGSNVTPTSISFWVNAVAMFNGGTGYTIGFNASGTHTLQGQGSTGKILIYDGTDRVATNTWAVGSFQHYVFIYSTSPSNGYDIYLNGSFLERLASNQITLGVFGRSGGFSPEMNLDEVGFWSRALSAGEVSDLYNGGAGLPYPLVVPVKGRSFMTTNTSFWGG